jgi:hypothetical protein
LSLFAHLLQKGFDWHLKLLPEQIDKSVFASRDFAPENSLPDDKNIATLSSGDDVSRPSGST